MKRNRNTVVVGLVILIIIIIAWMVTPFFTTTPIKSLKYSEFYNQLEKNNLKNIEINIDQGSYTVTGEFNKPYTDKSEKEKINYLTTKKEKTKYYKFTSAVPSDVAVSQLTKKIKENKLSVKVNPYSPPIGIGEVLSFVSIVGGIVLAFYLFRNLSKQQEKMMEPGDFKGKKILKSSMKFDDVAAYKEEKKELIEIVDFLQHPNEYTKMGARIPKGILLVGPPGTGKTLLAKAVAGEAGVNFIMQSGSEFVEMFVGVGASRVRKLFKEAQKSKPCIIFIDEIDAIGRHRGSGTGGGNDEREQTLNQILIEMDGFVGNSGIVVMAATNRVDVLDNALLRPGRFDRQIQVNLPNLKEREEILQLHASKRVIGEDVDLTEVAKNTSGFSGAQLENVINEAAIMAVRHHKTVIDKQEVSEGIDRVVMGPAKKTRKYTPEDKKIIAYHETGHVVIGLDLEDADVIQKVTIIPRGDAGGYAMHSPKEDRFNYTKEHLLEKITGLLGGRAAEMTFCNVQTAGAHNDFEQATKLARSMVVEYGMSNLGVYQYMLREDDERGYTNRRYSEDIAEKIDIEINKILNSCFEKAIEILNRRKEDVNLIANGLIEVETLERNDIDYLLKNKELPESLKINSSNEKEEFDEYIAN